MRQLQRPHASCLYATYRLDKARFASGLVTATELLLSEAGQTKARGALVQAVTDADLVILSLRRALGEARPPES